MERLLSNFDNVKRKGIRLPACFNGQIREIHDGDAWLEKSALATRRKERRKRA